MSDSNLTPSVTAESGPESGVPGVAELLQIVAEATVTGAEPVIEAVTVSVAVTVWLPTVLSVALKVPAAGQGRIAGQHRDGVGASEVDRAGVAGSGVAVDVLGGDGEAEGHAGSDRGRGGHRQGAGHRRADRHGGRAGDRGGDRVSGGDRLAACGLQGQAGECPHPLVGGGKV